MNGLLSGRSAVNHDETVPLLDCIFGLPLHVPQVEVPQVTQRNQVPCGRVLAVTGRVRNVLLW